MTVYTPRNYVELDFNYTTDMNIVMFIGEQRIEVEADKINKFLGNTAPKGRVWFLTNINQTINPCHRVEITEPDYEGDDYMITLMVPVPEYGMVRRDVYYAKKAY